jgi:hypothetical protein
MKLVDTKLEVLKECFEKLAIVLEQNTDPD